MFQRAVALQRNTISQSVRRALSNESNHQLSKALSNSGDHLPSQQQQHQHQQDEIAYTSFAQFTETVCDSMGVNEDLKSMLARLGTRIIDECGPNIREMVNVEIEKLALQVGVDTEQDLSISMAGIAHTRRYTEKENQELYLRRKSISEDPDSHYASWISDTWKSVQSFFEMMKNYMEGLFVNLEQALIGTSSSIDRSSSSSLSSDPRHTMSKKHTANSVILGIVVSLVAGYCLMAKFGFLGQPWIRSMLGKALPPSL